MTLGSRTLDLVFPLRWVAGVVATLVLTGLGKSASAQIIRGQVVEESSGAPIDAGFVVLLNAAGKEVFRTLADRAGRFTIRAPAAGTYRIRSERIGYRLAVSPDIALATGQTLEYRMSVVAIPVQLSTIQISAESKCRSSLEEGRNTAMLFEEARKALSAVAWVQSQRYLRVAGRKFVRRLDIDLRVASDSGTPFGGLSRRPITSLPAQELATRGYVYREGDGDYMFWAPDAEVLFSSSFLNQHCFRLQQGHDETEGLIGLAFEPVGKRDVADIEGVMWLDAQSAALRWVDFSYTHLKFFPVSDKRIGGRVEFLGLDNGAWVVRRGAIRMPVVGTESEQQVNDVRDIVRERRVSKRPVITGFKEDGVELTDVLTSDGTRLASAEGATLTGIVFDSTRMAPLLGARVVLAGTRYVAISSGGGRFRMDGIPEGTYEIVFSHPDMPAWGVLPGISRVMLSRAAINTVSLTVPPLARLLTVLCPGSDTATARGIAAGIVRVDGNGPPIAGANVRITWSNWDLRTVQDRTATSSQIMESRAGVETVTDSTGYYLMCGLPNNHPLDAQVLVGERAGPVVELKIPLGKLAEQDLQLERR